jgi:hypothetical protein
MNNIGLVIYVIISKYIKPNYRLHASSPHTLHYKALLDHNFERTLSPLLLYYLSTPFASKSGSKRIAGHGVARTHNLAHPPRVPSEMTTSK